MRSVFSTTIPRRTMLRMIQNISAAGAKSYYSTASTADYYTQGQELTGVWRGEGAKRLGLSGDIDREDWDALCDNRNPDTGGKLTPRQKEPRRVGYDFNFHVPKSVSLLYGLTEDPRILDAFRASVDETMRDMEVEMQTRVRKSGHNEDRTTGNMVWGEFVHLTARPVAGIPDPHLHAHCFVFNTTYDGKESRWKAGQFAGLKQDAPYFEALFHARMAHRIAELGLKVERTRTGWEIGGIPKSALDRFSRRTALIEAVARERGITDPGEKGELGAQTRQRKAKAMSMPELRQEWLTRMTDGERSSVTLAHQQIGGMPVPTNDKYREDAVRLGAEHCFERSAVVPERVLLAEALKRSVGTATAQSVMDAYRRIPFITAERNGRRMVTSREVLAEEQNILNFARDGRGTCRALASADRPFERSWLDDEQKRAVRHLWHSKDRVMLVRGAAGTGKTTLMQEAVAGIQAGGKQVFTFAPSSGASRGVLREAGFSSSETVAMLLDDPKLQSRIRDQVVWVDEAGQLSSRTTANLFDLAKRESARLILSGDKRQHGSVERGGILRLLEEEAGLPTASLTQIKRQQHAEYKKAVKALSEGRAAEGLRKLDQLGWIKEIRSEDRYQALAQAYLDSVKQPGDTLVISPTHREAAQIVSTVRDALRADGKLGKTEHQVPILRPVSLTTAERCDRANLLPGDTLILHQNIPGHRKGEHLVVGRDELPLEHPDRFSVYRSGSLALAAGDRVRITRNAKLEDGTRLNNGDLFTVRAIAADGAITLSNDATLPAGFGHLDQGYVVTSFASQGKSVDRLIVGQSSDSFAASSREQAYVTASRARFQLTLFTDDKRGLFDAVNSGDDRLTATELVNQRIRRREYAYASHPHPDRVHAPQRGEVGGHPVHWQESGRL